MRARCIICPMINTAEQAAEFVSYLRYPPTGQRSFGPTRAAFAQGANIHAEANDEIIGWAMVETKEAMANLDAIAATPGLDGIYVGPADLAFSFCDGKLPPGFDCEEPELIEALPTIVQTCHKHGIKAALHCGTAEYAARAIGWGYDMTTASGGSRLLAGAAAASAKTFREAISRKQANSVTTKGGLMLHVIVAGKLHTSGCALPDSAPGLTVHYIDENSEESDAPYVHEADTLLIRTQPMSAATIAKAKKMKVVSRHSVGYDAVDIAALNKQGTTLAICGDVNCYSVVEHACMMILAAGIPPR